MAMKTSHSPLIFGLCKKKKAQTPILGFGSLAHHRAKVMNEDISARAWSDVTGNQFHNNKQKNDTVPMTKSLKTTDTEELD